MFGDNESVMESFGAFEFAIPSGTVSHRATISGLWIRSGQKYDRQGSCSRCILVSDTNFRRINVCRRTRHS